METIPQTGLLAPPQTTVLTPTVSPGFSQQTALLLTRPSFPVPLLTHL